MDNFNIPFVLNWRAWRSKEEDVSLGVLVGTTVGLIPKLSLDDDSQSGYILEPNGLSLYEAGFDPEGFGFDFNVFGAVGLSAEYRRWMLRATYNFSFTDPYRKNPTTDESISQ